MHYITAKSILYAINGILDYCIDAGVYGIICFGMGLTLREGNREYFYKNLDKHFPGLKNEYIRRYGSSYMLDSPNSRELSAIFKRCCDENGIERNIDKIFNYLNEFEQKTQLSLFD